MSPAADRDLITADKGAITPCLDLSRRDPIPSLFEAPTKTLFFSGDCKLREWLRKTIPFLAVFNFRSNTLLLEISETSAFSANISLPAFLLFPFVVYFDISKLRTNSKIYE
jgi:hypothetical protein